MYMYKCNVCIIVIHTVIIKISKQLQNVCVCLYAIYMGNVKEGEFDKDFKQLL